MTQAMLTFVAPLPPARLGEAEAAIDGLGNPATAEIRRALDLDEGEEEGVHFASLHALRTSDGRGAHIVLELSADGSDVSATAHVARALGPSLKPVLMLASDWAGDDVGAYLAAHRVRTGNGLFGHPGVAFSGAPGFSVGRIRFEKRLAEVCAGLVEAQRTANEPALSRLAAVRSRIAADPDLRRALEPATPAPPFGGGNLRGLVAAGLVQFAGLYLWPLLVLVLLAGVGAGIVEAGGTLGFWPSVGAFLLGAVRMVWAGLWVALAVAVVGVVTLYVALRDAEENDSVETHTTPPDLDRAMFERENRLAQNHMISVTQRKPGWLRWFTARLVFWVIGLAATRYFRPGFLSDIGTIHFARWVTVPGTRDTLFMSNYGGSWESYLEDFITKAHAGLTAVWSNTVGFPKTQNLFQLGATDGDRFKRFARRSMVPTRFWYSAYPETTTGSMRANALIRAGLSGVMTEDEALGWLALFGSASRPSANLVSTDIQSLIFGGLGFMPFGTCLVCRLPDDPGAARAWLAELRRHIAFSDGRRLGHDAVVTLALDWHGLLKLGLPEETAASFPLAFIDGMTADYRKRILGDEGANDPQHWRWGRDRPDAAVLVYGRSEDAMARLRDDVLALCRQAGMPEPHPVPLEPVTSNKKEPFGFVDGISQPLIRGTYKSRRNADAIHIVEPGEMILGYPDNRGYVPPSPTLRASADPANKLPLLGAPNGFSRAVAGTLRDIGFNGSFLVIRELEQDVDAFWAYCDGEAKRLQGRLAPPYGVSREFIGAKLVGRWPDGSSLVREPYEPATAHRDKVRRRIAQATTLGRDLAVESIDILPSVRPRSHPRGGTPIDPAEAHPAKPAPASATASGAHQAHGGQGTPVQPDNDFLFGAEDPQGLRCPYGAHIRRANPRDSLFPGDADQVAISNRHRISRVGRFYKPESGQKPGLLFMCFCADIERQFEFLQQTWLRSPGFHDLGRESDPLFGERDKGNEVFTVPTPDGPIGLGPMQRFVTTRGGGYFFLPGRRLIDFLVDPR